MGREEKQGNTGEPSWAASGIMGSQPPAFFVCLFFSLADAGEDSRDLRFS